VKYWLLNLEIPAKLPAKNPLRNKTVKGALLYEPVPFRFIQIVPICPKPLTLFILPVQLSG
jgi:hypothetical protein